MEIEKKINLDQVCSILGKSKRTIARYIKKGLLNPMKELEKEGGITDKDRERELSTKETEWGKKEES